MVRIDVVVTRGGDGGETSLGDGARLRKDAPRIAAIGTVDEANAAIGMLRLATRDEPEVDAMLARIQNDMFDVGADLSVPGEGGDRLRLSDVPVSRLEAEVAAMNARLPKLTSFVLPGGRPGAAHAHMARTVVRRAERDVVRLAAGQAVTPALLRYLNRLSDHLFVLARVLNANGAEDVPWTPGANLGA
ncbi:MAG TPA: cob(I)yrinic acid a,c-diamide adenosyltransferase [Acetobacteraceae bacterium]|jgi:cob(I)alamin adenosyltransferase|nr:cob(I)yrinic acid a,c-diamide adenosyltransferase [Acetobacteraceae bacterium]